MGMADTVQIIGKYRILDTLGKGGFATVYRAVDTTLDREVALKVLDPLLMRDETWVGRFNREAKAVAALKHPHIVPIYEIEEAGGRLFIAMELVEGRSLARFLAEYGRLPWAATMKIVRQTAMALDYAHRQGVIHRDLKPSNIMLDQQRGVVLTDFGFAKLVGDSSVSASLSGGIVGTPAYISPSVWDGKPATIQTDLYALACVIYEMVTGEVLFNGETPLQSLRAHDSGPDYPELWPDGVPDRIESVLDIALGYKASTCFSHAGEVWEAMLALSGQSPDQARTSDKSDKSLTAYASSSQAEHLASSETRRPFWQWGLVALIGVFIVLGSGLLVKKRMLSFNAASLPTATLTVDSAVNSTIDTPEPTQVPTLIDPSTATVTPEAGAVRLREADDMAMVYVPPGISEMGDAVGNRTVRPVHEVMIDAFWLDQTEVTNAQYQRCVQAGDCVESRCADHAIYSGPDHPVVCVSWEDAQAYCRWVDGRLPTEAEWERAARGPQAWIYPWGDDFDCTRGNFDDETALDAYTVPGGVNCDGYPRTAPVGMFSSGASWIGALDLAGNVWEWTADWYGETYYAVSPRDNPLGPESGQRRVLRGGSWYYVLEGIRSTTRHSLKPTETNGSSGFRCAVSANSSE
jgi:serine/threonine-protein kinase